MLVIRKRNIVKAQIDTKGSTKEDIRIQSPMGDYQNIQRKELLKNYRYLQNKKINLHGWKRDTYYIIYNTDNSKMYAMQVPISITAYVNGTIANSTKGKKSGDYIVCYGGADGKLDKRTARIIQASIFHKMFSIPRNEIILKHSKKPKNRPKKCFIPPRRYLIQSAGPVDTLGKIPKTQQVQKVTSDNNTQKTNQAQSGGQMKAGFNRQIHIRPSYKINTATLPNVDKNIARPMGTPKQNPVKTVGKLLRGSVLVGFVIQNGQGVKRVNTNQMKVLIANGTITDVMVQRNSYGMEYFRGNGIQIESLPVKQI